MFLTEFIHLPAFLVTLKAELPEQNKEKENDALLSLQITRNVTKEVEHFFKDVEIQSNS